MTAKNNPSQDKPGISRRKFMATTATGLAGLTILPGGIISAKGRVAPSDKLQIAGIGVGGMGKRNLENMATENIVALCDVDWHYSKGTFAAFPNAKKYKDFRKMFDEMGDSIDAVMIATPDHTHAIAASHAMKMGKHVYIQKPLTHSVYESRYLTELAREMQVVTQMGNQGNSGEGIRQICEWIWDGAIGEVAHVDTWTNRPIWPQGLERPTQIVTPPETLDWDLFLGPAESRPYHPTYTPWNWRGWWAFGTGALGDMACHIIDPVFKALKLKYPDRVQGSSTQLNTESPPLAEIVTYHFPEREALPNLKMPDVTVKWYDGGLLPERPKELPEGDLMGRDLSGGCLFHGTKGKLMCGCYGKNPTLLPYSEMDHYKKPPKTLRRIKSSHEMDWVNACKKGYENARENNIMPSSNFDYSGPLNEMVVMGVVAVRLQDLKRELKWDGEKMEFLNVNPGDEIRVVTSDHFEVVDGHPEFDTRHTTINAEEAAREYIKHTYREGWSL